MPTLAEVRQQYPQYNDMSDDALASALHAKFYSDMPKEEFDRKIGYNQQPPKQDFAISDAVTDIPSEIGKAAMEGVDNVRALSRRGEMGQLEGLEATGKAVIAPLQIIAAPITGAARSLIGHAMAYGEHKIGELIAPQTAAKDDAQKMYEQAKQDVDTAMSAMASRGAPVSAAPAVAPKINGDVVNAAERLSQLGSNVDVPLAIASESPTVQRIGQGIRNVPIVGDSIPQATSNLVEGLSGATKNIADQYGTGSGPNVANRVGRNLQGAADAETQAATEAARQSDEALLAAHQRDTDTAHQAIAGHENSALEAARQSVGDMSPQDMGATLIDRLRTEEASARARKDALYEQAGNSDASVAANDVRNVRSIIAQGLENGGVVVDPQLTPAASRMMDELQRLSDLSIPNRAIGARLPASGSETPVAVNAQGLEQARKRLSFFRSAASNDADRRAASNVMRQFDDWQSHVFENALFSGSDEALNTFRQARAANTSWRDRFFNQEDDAGRFINRIVTGEITPQETANYIVGAGKVGAKGVSSRLLTRIADATGNDPEALQAIRGGIWNRLSQSTQGVEAKQPARVANDISEFLSGSGRDVANRLFSPEQRRLMQSYAETLRNGQDARQLVGDVAKTTKPGTMAVQPGPMQQLADTVIGKGGKSDEALFRTIDGYAKSGGRADIQTLAKLVRAIPEQDKADLAGSIIRNLGISPRTGQFSPDVFVSQWKTYTPQAKTILFGNAGPQRQALDDIATISDRLKQVGQKFGNPSGTAQNVNLFALASGFIAAPMTTLASVVGGNIAARILAAPAGASSASKWTKAYAALTTRPSAHTLAAYQVASRNLANTAQGFGSNAGVLDFMRVLQGPVPSSAQDKQK